MRISLLISTSILLLILFSGCSTDSNSFPQLNVEGSFGKPSLTRQEIFELKRNGEFLYAGTNKGLFQTQRGNKEPNWRPLFHQKSILDFIVWNRQELLIGTPISDPQAVSIFITASGGDSWQPYQNGFGTKNSNNHLFVVEKNPENPKILFARGDFNVAMSPDSGKKWTNLVGSWDGFGDGRFLTIASSDPQEIWAGGATATFSPHLFKTTNGGRTWQNIDIIKNIETTVHDAIIQPSNSNVVLTGMAGNVEPANIIRKSTDDGKTWKTVLENIKTYTLTHSARDPQTVYASGRNASGTLFFAASRDFGDTWETVEMPDSPTNIQVNDMVSVMQDGREVLYLGTNKGVYSYRFEK